MALAGLGPNLQFLFRVGPGLGQNFYFYFGPGRAEIGAIQAGPVPKKIRKPLMQALTKWPLNNLLAKYL